MAPQHSRLQEAFPSLAFVCFGLADANSLRVCEKRFCFVMLQFSVFNRKVQGESKDSGWHSTPEISRTNVNRTRS